MPYSLNSYIYIIPQYQIKISMHIYIYIHIHTQPRCIYIYNPIYIYIYIYIIYIYIYMPSSFYRYSYHVAMKFSDFFSVYPAEVSRVFLRHAEALSQSLATHRHLQKWDESWIKHVPSLLAAPRSGISFVQKIVILPTKRKIF